MSSYERSPNTQRRYMRQLRERINNDRSDHSILFSDPFNEAWPLSQQQISSDDEKWSIPSISSPDSQATLPFDALRPRLLVSPPQRFLPPIRRTRSRVDDEPRPPAVRLRAVVASHSPPSLETDPEDDRHRDSTGRYAFLGVSFTDDDTYHNEQKIVLFRWSRTSKKLSRKSQGYATMIHEYNVSLNKRVSVYLGRPVTVTDIARREALGDNAVVQADRSKCVQVE